MVTLVSTVYLCCYTSDMYYIPQIWEDGSTYRSDIKKSAAAIVRSRYTLFPTAELDAKEYREHVKGEVEDLLKSANFLRNGRDAQA